MGVTWALVVSYNPYLIYKISIMRQLESSEDPQVDAANTPGCDSESTDAGLWILM